MTSYRCFSSGVKNRKLIILDENYLNETFNIINNNPNKDYYESIYIYNDEHYKQFKKTGSLSGITGISTDRIVFDFDSKVVSEALQDTRELLKRIPDSVPESAVRCFFSANKGFHVEVHLNQTVTRPEFEAVVEHFAGNLKTFDHKIKDEQRLFRYPLTRHNKTGRFKIPLSLVQIENMSLEEIEKLSLKTDHEDFADLLNSYTTTKLFVDPATLIKEKKKETPVATMTQSDHPEMSRKPKHLTAAKFALQEGFFEEGERNEACMILASTYKYLGYSDKHTYSILKETLRMRTARLDLSEITEADKEELWETIIEPIYSPLWKGGTFSEDGGLLKLTIDRYDLENAGLGDTSLVDLSSLSSTFMDFAVNIDANTIKLGIEEIDKKLRITTSSLVAFLAAPSAGKSSVSFGILNTVSKSGEKSIFFSMDMSIPQVYQRLIQRHTGHDEDKIMNNYKNRVMHEIERYQNILGEEYPNVKFCFKSGMSVKEVRATIIDHQQKTGILPRLVVLDYLECMTAEGISDSTQSKAQISTALKGVANELGVCIILLVQPRMMAGGPAGELNSYTDIKGSSVISESAAQVITMSRPGFSPKNPDDDNYVTINIVKNRLGKLSSTDLHWDGLTGHIRSLSGEEENDLKALRKEIASEKAEKDDGDLY